MDLNRKVMQLSMKFSKECEYKTALSIEIPESFVAFMKDIRA